MESAPTAGSQKISTLEKRFVWLVALDSRALVLVLAKNHVLMGVSSWFLGLIRFTLE